MLQLNRDLHPRFHSLNFIRSQDCSFNKIVLFGSCIHFGLAFILCQDICGIEIITADSAIMRLILLTMNTINSVHTIGLFKIIIKIVTDARDLFYTVKLKTYYHITKYF